MDRPLPAFALLLCAIAPFHAAGQAPVRIRVDAAAPGVGIKPIWTYFGYDEPNYTYAPHGRKLLSELAGLSRTPVYVRTHNLLTSGDGTPQLKWGSTNAYTEDAAGRPVYNWTILDRIFDAYRDAGVRPFVEIGFTPEALSVKPQPYQPTAPLAIHTGCSYPPKDYRKWGELVRQWVLHEVERYGRTEVESWYWEVWNEPDIQYWHGTPEEYNQLYDFAADGVKRALPGARIGGPASTGPGSAKAAAFLEQFLKHCAGGKNYATGKTGAPLDFISFHAKGRPEMADGHLRMGLAQNLRDVERGLEIVNAFPQFRTLPIYLTESDPEGCAACPATAYPQNAYRNGPLYAAYTAVALHNIRKLAARSGNRIEAMLTWAFEFESQPFFAGYRTLATNGVDKPVLNLFRMAGLMQGEAIPLQSSAALGLDTLASSGARSAPDIDGFATRSERRISTMIWHYHDDDVPAPDASIDLAVSGVPASARRVLVRHYRIDGDHSNAHTAWRMMGSPQSPAPGQYARLEAAGQLELIGSPQWVSNERGSIRLQFALPRQAVSLIEVSW